ncbi:MAG: hypothetical protein JWP65_3477 [Ramlibacter sp.]|jgi:hypothetical protein|uniref:hypothetical protein n=1 Tax=Ramlibacter sp. TaxID=1917967 RepID=UPI00260D2749|nr:hypothetical protein [Ramlibacter sp.]MDB5753056.1 hypothetical protein [Ramlibacter sp.]
MPEMHQNAAAAAGMPPTLEVVARWATDDADYALGCECADPALQIERWGLDDDGQSS